MQIKTFQNIVLLEQTLFGLPWVATSIGLAMMQSHAQGAVLELFWQHCIWIALAFLSARMAGMAMNRVIDRAIDAQNPRTQVRALPRKETSATAVWSLALLAVGLFVVSCGMLGPMCLNLSPIALALLFGYSYTKRFTAFCHFFLGAIHFCAPLFAWVALRGTFDYAPLFLGTAVMLSIAGSDIIYALLDVEFDRSAGVHSMPLLIGVDRAVWLSKCLHGLAIGFLILAGYSAYAPIPYYMGVVVVAFIYLFSHASLHPEHPEKIARFLEECNRRVALSFMVTTLCALVWQRW